jgi:hypothetical protein
MGADEYIATEEDKSEDSRPSISDFNAAADEVQTGQNTTPVHWT